MTINSASGEGTVALSNVAAVSVNGHTYVLYGVGSGEDQYLYKVVSTNSVDLYQSNYFVNLQARLAAAGYDTMDVETAAANFGFTIAGSTPSEDTP